MDLAIRFEFENWKKEHKMTYKQWEKSLLGGMEIYLDISYKKNNEKHERIIGVFRGDFVKSYNNIPSKTFILTIEDYALKYKDNWDKYNLDLKIETNTFEEVIEYLKNKKLISIKDFVKGEYPNLKKVRYSLNELNKKALKKDFSFAKIISEDSEEYLISVMISKRKKDYKLFVLKRPTTQRKANATNIQINVKTIEEIVEYLDKKKILKKEEWINDDEAKTN